MKLLIALALFIAVAVAIPPPADVHVLKTDYTADLNTYTFGFEQSDGQKREEHGEIKHLGTEDEGISVRGSFSFVGDDGQTYTVTYVADEHGFQPSAAHLPVAHV